MSTTLHTASNFGLNIIGNVILRDMAYLDAPFWIIEDLLKEGYLVESIKQVPLHDLQAAICQPVLSVKIEGLEFGGRSLM